MSITDLFGKNKRPFLRNSDRVFRARLWHGSFFRTLDSSAFWVERSTAMSNVVATLHPASRFSGGLHRWQKKGNKNAVVAVSTRVRRK
jgi:hypothetical protein